jgi:YHS domain-containing protein
MKSNLILSALATALLGVALTVSAADAPKKGPTTKPSTPATKPTKAVNKNCPVESEHEVDPKVTRLYQGKLIGFCCNDCLETFDKDPEKWAKRVK